MVENYYYQGIMDAYSRYIIAWDIYAEGTAFNTSLVLQEAFNRTTGLTLDNTEIKCDNTNITFDND